MKIALVYDWLDSWGGAERLLLAFNKLFPQAPIYTSLYNKKKAPWAQVFPQVNAAWNQNNLPSHRILAPLMPITFENFNFDQYNLVISLTSFAAKGIITKPPTKHICYLLTPTRFLWYPNQYQTNFPKGIRNYLKKWDLVAAQRPDKMVAISQTVSNRCQEIYRQDSQIIYPPLDNQFLKLNPQKPISKERFFLVVSRLERQKKVDLVINCFNDLGWKLVIIGTGSQEKKLKRMAGKNINFLGFLPDQTLIDYYRKAQALIFPQEEDFGLVPLEALACQTPVIAYRSGGVTETVKDGLTGAFFYPQTSQALKKLLLNWSKNDYNINRYRCKLKNFSQERFTASWQKLINDYDVSG